MRIRSASVSIRTPAKVSVVNVTADVARALAEDPIRSGLALLSVPHTTCGVCVNEDEAGLRKDIVRLGSHLLDPLAREGPFEHDRIDDNARAHLAAVLLGHATSVPVADGALRLGTWQSLFLLELDGPRERRLEVMFVGE